MHRPLVISHAACGGHSPENTLAGIRMAISLGSEAIEIDLHASADGVPVLMHDPTVDRTTDGTGAVAQLSFGQLRELDAGGEPVPTLSEALQATRGRALLVMEIKQPGIEEAVAAVVHDLGALTDVMAWSFFPQALAGMRRVEPRVPCGLLIAPQSLPAWPEQRALALQLGLQAVSVFFAGVTAAVSADCRRSGLALYAWTVDSAKEISRLIDLGVDGICSNFPDRVAEALGGRVASGGAGERPDA